MENVNKYPDFQKMAEQMLHDLPQKVADHALEFFKNSFENEGFNDSSFIPWPLRKDKKSHRLLNKSESLKNSLKITSQTIEKIEIIAGDGLPYAEIQNTGGVINIKSDKKPRTIEIPQRKFIGSSQTLNKEIDKIALKEIVSTPFTYKNIEQ